jgi:hypothetical protein
MLFAGNIGQFAIVGPFPPGVNGVLVSTGSTVEVAIGGIAVTPGDDGALKQAVSPAVKTIKAMSAIFTVQVESPFLS